MNGRIRTFLVRGSDILASEGLKPMLVRGFDYFRRRVITYRKFYLYEHTLLERNVSDFMPRLENYEFKIIGSNEDVAAPTIKDEVCPPTSGGPDRGQLPRSRSLGPPDRRGAT